MIGQLVCLPGSKFFRWWRQLCFCLRSSRQPRSKKTDQIKPQLITQSTQLHIIIIENCTMRPSHHHYINSPTQSTKARKTTFNFVLCSWHISCYAFLGLFWFYCPPICSYLVHCFSSILIRFCFIFVVTSLPKYTLVLFFCCRFFQFQCFYLPFPRFRSIFPIVCLLLLFPIGIIALILYYGCI